MTIDRFINEFSFLSNFYPSTVKLDNMLYPTVEHAYQAAKTLDFEQRVMIKNAKTPAEAKKLGRCVSLREDWDTIKFNIMENLVHDKFSSPFLQNALILTHDHELIEGNFWNDTYWGVCRGVGQNKLGKILMAERKYLIEKSKHEKF